MRKRMYLSPKPAHQGPIMTFTIVHVLSGVHSAHTESIFMQWKSPLTPRAALWRKNQMQPELPKQSPIPRH